MRQRLVPPRRGQGGFTLVEVMVAALILMVGVLGTFVMIDRASETTRQNNARTAASAIGREILEQARTVDYAKITPAQFVPELRAKPALEGTLDSSGNWVLRQRNMTVTVSTSVCTYDDPSDGRGDPATPVVNACPAGAGTSTAVDSNPDDFRRVTVTLRWTERGRPRQVVQTSQLNNPSGGLGPRIITFPNPNAGNQILAGTTSITFTATSSYANNISWSADDGRPAGRGSLTGGGEAWSWSWPIGTVDSGTPRVDWVVDGAYTINAQPFDARGVPGEMRVASVWLNRRRPLAPSGFLGGRSSQGGGSVTVVEMDWNANVERDIAGYRVYRVVGDDDEEDQVVSRVCPPVTAGLDAVTRSLSCTDPLPPAGGQLAYRLVAIDREDIKNPTSLLREGTVATINVPPSLGTRLAAPTNLRAATTLSQKPQLNWTAPPVPSGEGIYFYRIYRDGVRYSRTGGPATEFVDPAPTTTAHRYQVSAVSSPSYNEGHLSTAVDWRLGG